jgi:hypothetical protein
MPPPVTCARARTSPASSSGAAARGTSGAGRAGRRRGSVRRVAGSSGSRSRPLATDAPARSRWSAGRPTRGPAARRPRARRGRRRCASRLTMPTIVPTTSISPAAYTPGISAVSPPSSATPASRQASATPPTTSATVRGRAGRWRRSRGRTAAGPLDQDVVDAVVDEVAAEAPHAPERDPSRVLVPTPSVEATSTGSARRSAARTARRTPRGPAAPAACRSTRRRRGSLQRLVGGVEVDAGRGVRRAPRPPGRGGLVHHRRSTIPEAHVDWPVPLVLHVWLPVPLPGLDYLAPHDAPPDVGGGGLRPDGSRPTSTRRAPRRPRRPAPGGALAGGLRVGWVAAVRPARRRRRSTCAPRSPGSRRRVAAGPVGAMLAAQAARCAVPIGVSVAAFGGPPACAGPWRHLGAARDAATPAELLGAEGHALADGGWHDADDLDAELLDDWRRHGLVDERVAEVEPQLERRLVALRPADASLAGARRRPSGRRWRGWRPGAVRQRGGAGARRRRPGRRRPRAGRQGLRRLRSS